MITLKFFANITSKLTPVSLKIPGSEYYIINRHKDSSIRCQCHGSQQYRTFLSFPRSSRKREYNGRQLVGHSKEQMFAVVSDVENYHKFVPWCKKSLILKRNPDTLWADLIVGFPPINESYTSKVSLVKPHLVRAECTDGKLFQYMLTLWRFSPGLKRVQQSCVVDFQIAFEFKTAFHSHLTNLFFDQVAKKMENAFIQEVGRRFGPATMTPRNLLVSTQTLKS